MIWSVSTCVLNEQSISPQNNLFTWYLNGATVNYGIGDTDSMSADLRPPATFDFTAALRGAASRVRNFESQVWHGSADSSRRKCVRLASRSDDEFVPHELNAGHASELTRFHLQVQAVEVQQVLVL